MTRWTHTLPDVALTTPQEHAESALRWLTHALTDSHEDPSRVLWDVQCAAAHLRAWRKTLPEQGSRIDSIYHYRCTDRQLLRLAIHFTLYADEHVPLDTVRQLRHAEAVLRVLGKRLAAREES